MQLIDRIVQFHAEIQSIRRDIHAHPELRYEEHRTSDLVAMRADLLAWRMADERVSVFSRNHRREFFLTIVADLPETISVDSYTLKAQVTDENSAAVAEKLIRIDVVADASAFRGS